MSNEILIHKTDNQQIEVRLDGAKDTVWLSQAQLVDLFERDQSVISRHVRNVFKDGELEQECNMQKMHIASSDKPVALYSLDVIISVGYRVKSAQGVRFRQWATQRLKDYLVQGYAINQQRVSWVKPQTRRLGRASETQQRLPSTPQSSIPARWITASA